MGSWLCVCLGTWHPYKQAATVVWAHWGPRFLAPLFHHLVPNANFNKSAKLVTILTYFTYIRLAYPAFAAELKSAVATARAMPQDPSVLSNLLDLRIFLTYFIPVVSPH